MSVTREFLGWNQPCLVGAAQYLIERYMQESKLDMRAATLVLPVGRAGRRLLEILVEEAEKIGKTLVPPRIETVGRLPELLYRPSRPLASELQNLLAWQAVLQETPATELEQLLPILPHQHDFTAWVVLAERFCTLYVDVAGGGLQPEEVAQKCMTLPDFNDEVRWHIFQGLTTRYHARLQKHNLLDRHAARLEALQHDSLQYKGEIYLISAVDLNQISRLLLQKVTSPIAALMHAPAERQNAFDEFGCVIPSAWEDAPIDIPDDKLAVVATPTDQAAATIRALALHSGNYSAEEITVGVADETLTPYVLQQMQGAALPVRDAAGIPTLSTSPLQLLEALAQFLTSQRFFDFASLVRHVDLQAWLATTLSTSPDQGNPGEEFVKSLDQYHRAHLQSVIGDKIVGVDTSAAAVNTVYGTVQTLLEAFESSKQPLAHWAQVLADFLIKVYGDRSYNRNSDSDRIIIEACDGVREVLTDYTTLETSFVPPVTAAEAIKLLMQKLSIHSIRPEPKEQALEVLGWLELQLDDAPLLVVSGMNVGKVPSAINADPFLPDTVRKHLGLIDNSRRYARDAFALSAILHSRPHVHLIAGLKAASNEPLLPSRLLFACDADTLAQRVNRFFGDSGTSAGGASSPMLPQLASLPPKRKPSFRIPPHPEPLACPPRKVSVTGFRAYLRCPYRYYLSQILGLKVCNDRAFEMDAGHFGSLAHAVLNDFGTSGVANSVDADEIRNYLRTRLDEIFKINFGVHSLPAVLVQLHQLHSRLSAFAVWQAQWAQQGWRIHACEFSPAGAAIDIAVGDTKLEVDGRIDRIDYHAEQNEWAVIDYKTGEGGSDPDETHLRGREKEWFDLQLPIYRHIWERHLKQEGQNGKIRLGYVVLPKDLAQVSFKEATWSAEQLEEAYAIMAEVAKNIVDQNFWPPTALNSDYDDFAAICGVKQYLEDNLVNE
ncbi:PD-(D/E)XK nuclease family protein [Oligoflexia bacterium]|nr:PD-(D/E)XK nuclease family protein [Oligoflexia bacterium]